MNPIKWLYNDLKEDVKTVRYMFRQTRDGKPILDPVKKRLLFQAIKDAPRALFKESKIWLLVVVITLFMGILIGEQISVVKCNTFIRENFYNETVYVEDLSVIFPSIPILPGSPSEEDSKQQNDSQSTPMNPNGE